VVPMVDGARTQPVTVEHCPWCSAEVAPALPNCPACGATLQGDSDASLPGVTALDQDALSRAGRASAPKSRSRLLSWISGDYDDSADKPAPPGSLAPPPFEVRREMLRLEIEAETAILQAETDALAAEAELQAREHGATLQAEADATAADATAADATAPDPAAAPAIEPAAAPAIEPADANGAGDRPA
jgi:hypothetical protein